MIKAVLFDYGGVISPAGGPGTFVKQIADVLGIDVSELHIRDIHEKLRKGLISLEDYIDTVNDRYPGHPKIGPDIFLEGETLFVRNEPIVTFAAKLRQHGIRTAILSDIAEATAEAVKAHGGYDGFEPLILSYQVHAWKPELAMYEAAITALGVEPSEIIYIDDQERLLAPATRLGMHTVLALTPEQTVNDVAKLIAVANNIRV